MKKIPWIRTVYLYLFSVIGLVMLVVGTSGFISMALRAYVFTQADVQEKPYPAPYSMPITKEAALAIVEDGVDANGKKVEITAVEKEQLKNWLVAQAEYEKNYQPINYVTQRRHQDAARNLALVLVGLPLYLIHWSIIKKENKEEEEKKV